MTSSRIEAETLVQAPLEVVWQAITQPAQISRWFTDTAEITANARRFS